MNNIGAKAARRRHFDLVKQSCRSVHSGGGALPLIRNNGFQIGSWPAPEILATFYLPN